MKTVPVTVAYGDGVGPEIMTSVLEILKAAGAKIEINELSGIGEKAYTSGHMSGISPADWATILKNRVFLKAPITTPQGGGYKSLNVSIRKALGLYCNLRPCKSYHPFVQTSFPNLNIVIFRENEEDLYAGIEHKECENTIVGTKIITKEGSEKIIRAAFEYAKSNNRKKITCMTKDNIMKMCDGVFHKEFETIGKEYPEINQEHMIIDIGSAKLAHKPEQFDVIVTLNLYGDIISDIVAEVSGSVGLAGSSNLGNQYAMFEAIHGSAPLIAGQDKANPCGLLNGAILMLTHIGQGSVATIVENAMLSAIENGIVTKDIYKEGTSKKIVGTKEFTKQIISFIGKKPNSLKEAPKYPDFDFDNSISSVIHNTIKLTAKKEIVGFDAFIDKPCLTKDIAELVRKININGLSLKTISSKGLLVYSKDEMREIYSNHWRLRFLSSTTATSSDGVALLAELVKIKIDVARFSTLYNFDGKAGYSLEQSE